MIDTMRCRSTNFCDANAEAAAGAHAFLDRRLYPLIERDEVVRAKLDPCFVVFDFAAFNHTAPRTLQYFALVSCQLIITLLCLDGWNESLALVPAHIAPQTHHGMPFMFVVNGAEVEGANNARHFGGFMTVRHPGLRWSYVNATATENY